MNVSIWNYGEGRTKQPNTVGVTVSGLDLYFSYQTVVAYRSNGELVVRENEWGPTTGKHLNWIDGGNGKRISGSDFETRLTCVTAGLD